MASMLSQGSNLSKPFAAAIFTIFCIIFIAGTMDAGQDLMVGWSRDAGSLADKESVRLAARLGSNTGVSVKTVRFERIDALEDALEKGVIDIAVWPDYALLKDRVFLGGSLSCHRMRPPGRHGCT
jgi:hypothetical protein